jgi:hypothetical protein
LLRELRRLKVPASVLAGLVEKHELKAKVLECLAQQKARAAEREANQAAEKVKQEAKREADKAEKEQLQRKDRIVSEVMKWAQHKTIFAMLNEINGKQSSSEQGHVSRNSSEDDLARAYKKAVLKCHPDKHMGDFEGHLRATERFKALHEKYSKRKEEGPSSSQGDFQSWYRQANGGGFGGNRGGWGGGGGYGRRHGGRHSGGYNYY